MLNSMDLAKECCHVSKFRNIEHGRRLCGHVGHVYLDLEQIA